MAKEIKINQSSFNVDRRPQGGRDSGRNRTQGAIRKSSYVILEETQMAMKMLAIERHATLNELIQEAFDDLLAKYGKV